MGTERLMHKKLPSYNEKIKKEIGHQLVNYQPHRTLLFNNIVFILFALIVNLLGSLDLPFILIN